MEKKYLISATFFFSLLLFFQPYSVVQSQTKPIGGVYTTRMAADATTLNPLMWGSVYDLELITHMYESLVGVGVDNEPVPLMSKSWTYLPEENASLFTLRDNMKWHDGEVLDSSDVVFSFHMLRDDQLGDQKIVRNSFLFEYLINATALSSTEVKVFFTYTPKLADILWEVGLSWILPEHIWKDLDDVTTFENTSPIGSGPFTFGEWQKGQFVRFERFEDYHQPGPYVETKIIQIIREIETAIYALSVGDIETLSGDIPPELEDRAVADPDIERHLIYEDFWLYLGLNQRNYPNNVKEFRQAVLYGVNRSEIVEVARFGRNKVCPASGSLDWGPYYNPDVKQYDFDPAKANQMLDTLGFTDSNNDDIREDANGTDLSFDLLVSAEFERSIVAAEMMRDYMADIGIEINVVPILFDVLWNQIGGDGSGNYNYDWYYIGWTLFWSDRHPNWAYWLYSGSGYWGGTINLPGWEGPKQQQVTQLADEILFITNETKIKENLDLIQEIAAEELPYLPIDIVGTLSLYRTDEFAGWQLGPVSGPNNFWSDINLYLKDTGSETVVVTTISGQKTTVTITGTDGAPTLGLLAALSTVLILGVVFRKRRQI